MPRPDEPLPAALRRGIAVVSTGTLRTYVPVERAATFASEFGRHVPTSLLLPSWPDNSAFETSAAPARLVMLARGALEPLAKWWWLVRNRPSVVYCVGGWMRNVLPAFLARPFVGFKLVLDFDEVVSLWPGRRQALDRFLERTIVPRADAFVAVSETMCAWAREQGVPAGAVIYSPFAADTVTVAALAGVADAALQRSGGVRLGYLGTLLPQYDFSLLIDLLARLRATGVDASLDLVGDGPGRAAFEARAAELQVQDAIRYHGYHLLPSATPILAQCDVLLFPIRDTLNNRMRCPQKSYVYLAMGVAIVTCPVGEVLRALDGWAHFFDIEQLDEGLAAISSALAEPRGRRAERRQYAVASHSWPVRAAQCWRDLVRALASAAPREHSGLAESLAPTTARPPVVSQGGNRS